MSTKHIKDLIDRVKAGTMPIGWLADMAAIELGAIEDALKVVMTSKGAHTASSDYKAARDLLERVARGAP